MSRLVCPPPFLLDGSLLVEVVIELRRRRLPVTPTDVARVAPAVARRQLRRRFVV